MRPCDGGPDRTGGKAGECAFAVEFSRSRRSAGERCSGGKGKSRLAAPVGAAGGSEETSIEGYTATLPREA